MDLWLLLVAFAMGAAVWPLTQIVMEWIERRNTRKLVQLATQRREMEMAAARELNKMTVEEWESYYGPLPKDRPMLDPVVDKRDPADWPNVG